MTGAGLEWENLLCPKPFPLEEDEEKELLREEEEREWGYCSICFSTASARREICCLTEAGRREGISWMVLAMARISSMEYLRRGGGSPPWEG